MHALLIYNVMHACTVMISIAHAGINIREHIIIYIQTLTHVQSMTGTVSINLYQQNHNTTLVSTCQAGACTGKVCYHGIPMHVYYNII